MPDLSMERLEKVATPATAAMVSVPERVPVPGLAPMATVTLAVELVTVFAKASCTATRTAGAMATPAQGYQLEGWHGDIEGNNYNPIQFQVNGPMALSVKFVVAPPPVLEVTIIGRGSVSKSPDLPSYQVSTYATLTATPDPGSTRSARWTGASWNWRRSSSRGWRHRSTATRTRSPRDLTKRAYGSCGM